MNNLLRYSKLAQNDENNMQEEEEEETKREVIEIMKRVITTETFARCRSRVDLWVQRYRNSLLLAAVYNEDLVTVKTLLAQGAEANATCRKNRFTAVHLAVFVQSDEILSHLLENGANADVIDKHGLTPLHYSAWYDSPDVIPILIKHIRNDHQEGYLNRKALVAPHKHPVIPEHLKDSLDHTCKMFENKLNKVTIQSATTALHLACQRVNEKCVEILLTFKPNVNLEDDRGFTPLEVIGEFLTDKEETNDRKFVNIINLITFNNGKRGAKTSEEKGNYFSPIHAAVTLSSRHGIRLLLDAGLDASVLDIDGQTAVHLAVMNQLKESLKALLEYIADISTLRNMYGLTPFQTAVEQQWVYGVGLMLNANVNLTEVAADGRTVLHVAAVSGNVELLEELLKLEETEEILNARNKIGETPIFCAITSGNSQCVDALLKMEANISIKLEENINVLHRAAEQGHVEILASLLQTQHEQKLRLVDQLDTLSFSGMTPVHMAAYNGHVDCVKELLHWKCDYKKKTTSVPHLGSLAIHLAAGRGYDQVVEALLIHDPQLIQKVDEHNKTALHYAALQGHRKCIEVLLNADADLSTSYKDETALDIIFRTISRPTEFLENIFNHSIRIDDNNMSASDKHCMITINFGVLVPKNNRFNQMSILSHILSNGKGLEQRKLLLHPLIESFLHLKWNKMNKIFWMLLMLYALFVCFLTIFVISLFYYTNENRPQLLNNIETFRFTLVIFLLTVTTPELLLAWQKLKQYTMSIDRLIKWTSIILVMILVWTHPSNHQEDWLRHVATIAILTSWIELMFILSKFPRWGYYVQMFFKVAQNVIKVMTAFSFLVIGFALAFMIEFQRIEPFMDPLTGLIKTIVMMASELDYSGLFTGENKENAQIINLIIYVIFLILATIVLMNLMVGLAVSDIHDLEIIGKIDRHAEQIDFLAILESNTLARFLPNVIRKRLMKEKCVQSTLKLYPSYPKCKVMKVLPPKLRECIINVAENNIRKESQITHQQLYAKLEHLITLVDNINQKLQIK